MRASSVLARVGSYLLLCVLAWSSETTCTNAQVLVDMLEPPPAQMHLEAVWRINLINQGATTRAIRVYGVATDARSGRRIADGLSDVFDLPPGFTTVTPSDIGPIDYDADPEYEDVVLRTGTVPAGEYTICVYAIDDRSHDTLGRDCISQHVVVNVLPPHLIYPRDNSTVFELTPVFTWTPVFPMIPEIDVTYSIRVVEVVGRQSLFKAIESNPPWWEEEGLQSTVAPYPLSGQEFELGAMYAWQVTAFVGDRKGVKGELARSEVWSFSIAEHIDSSKKESADPFMLLGGIDIGSRSGGVDSNRIRSSTTKRTGGTTISGKAVGASAVVIVGTNSSGLCGDLHASIRHSQRRDSLFYTLTIANTYMGKDTNLLPKAFRVRLLGDHVSAINGVVNEGWRRIPETVSTPVGSILWSPTSGTIPRGDIELGELRLASGSADPISVVMEWLGDSTTIICSDSSVINEARFYYDLTPGVSAEYIDVSMPALNVQYINDYAAGDNIATTIYDALTREPVTMNASSRTTVNSINGQNRLSIPLEDYPLMVGRLYVLVVSDYKNNYRFNFKVTNDRHK